MRLGGQLVMVGAIMTLALAATLRSSEVAGAKAGRATAPDRYERRSRPDLPAATTGSAAPTPTGAAVALTGVGAGGTVWAERLNRGLSGRLGDAAGWATVEGAAESLPRSTRRTLLRVRWAIAGREGMADCGTTTVSAMEAEAVLAELGDAFAAATRRSDRMGTAVCG